jgi:hypothetical protein
MSARLQLPAERGDHGRLFFSPRIRSSFDPTPHANACLTVVRPKGNARLGHCLSDALDAFGA